MLHVFTNNVYHFIYQNANIHSQIHFNYHFNNLHIKIALLMMLIALDIINILEQSHSTTVGRALFSKVYFAHLLF